MKLKSLELANVCQYRQTLLTFTPGLNLVVGRNGSGKSNAMKMAYAAVTNDFGRNPGNKAANVRQGAPRDDPSFVILHMDHGDASFNVRRGLQSCGDLLIVRDGRGHEARRVHGSNAVTDEVLAIVGVSPKLLADYVFVDQGEIFSFLAQTPGARAKALQRLFGTEQAAGLYDLTVKRLSKLVVPSVGTSGEVLERQLADARQRLQEAERKLAEVAGFDEEYDPAKDNSCAPVVRAWEEKSRLVAEREELWLHVNAADFEVQSLRVEEGEHAKRLDAMNSYLAAERDRVADSLGALAQWDTFEKVSASRDKLRGQIARTKKDIANASTPLIGPPDYADPAPYAAVMADWNDAKLKIAEAERYLTTFRRHGLKDCPTCGTPVAELKVRVEHYERQLKIARECADKCRKIHLATYEHNQRVAERERFVKASQEFLEHFERQLADLPTVEPPPGSAGDLRALVRQYEEVEATVRAEQDAHSAVNKRLCAAEGRAEELHRTLVKLNERIAALDVTEEQCNSARSFMRARYERAKVKREAMTARRIAQEALQKASEALLGLASVRLEAEALGAWRERLGAIQEVVHYNSLPKVMAQTRLEEVEDEVNGLLRRFDSDFVVETTEGLTFKARFRRGKKAGAEQPAERLSWGEKVVLAVAFRVAVNSVFAKDTGLLVLDEPTAGLDDANLGCLGVAFERLRELSKARGLQVIMITHERNLPAADNLIEITSDA